jgi:hypothetical protein
MTDEVAVPLSEGKSGDLAALDVGIDDTSGSGSGSRGAQYGSNHERHDERQSILRQIDDGLVTADNYQQYVDSLISMADDAIQSNDYRSAYTLKERAMRIQTAHAPAVNDEQNMFLVDYLQDLAWLARQVQDLDQAEIFIVEAAEIVRTVVGGTHPDFAVLLATLSEILMQKGAFNQAVESLEVRAVT